jgi:hypothetical protein
MSNFLRYGWPRWWLIRIPDWMLGEWATERLNDFLYPSDLSVHIDGTVVAVGGEPGASAGESE